MPFAGHSQNADKVWIPRADALRVLAQADSAKVHKLVIAELKSDLSNTQAAVAQLKIAVAKAENADSLSRVNLKLGQEREALLRKQIELSESHAANWEKTARKERRKRIFASIAGTVTTVAAIAFALTK